MWILFNGAQISNRKLVLLIVNKFIFDLNNFKFQIRYSWLEIWANTFLYKQLQIAHGSLVLLMWEHNIVHRTVIENEVTPCKRVCSEGMYVVASCVADGVTSCTRVCSEEMDVVASCVPDGVSLCKRTNKHGQLIFIYCSVALSTKIMFKFTIVSYFSFRRKK